MPISIASIGSSAKRISDSEDTGSASDSDPSAACLRADAGLKENLGTPEREEGGGMAPVDLLGEKGGTLGGVPDIWGGLGLAVEEVGFVGVCGPGGGMVRFGVCGGVIGGGRGEMGGPPLEFARWWPLECCSVPGSSCNIVRK